MAAKRAEVLAKLAKFQKGGTATTPSSSSQRSASPSTTTTPPSGSRTNSPAPPSARSASPSEGGSPGSIDAIQRRIAEAKARLANTKSSGITVRLLDMMVY